MLDCSGGDGPVTALRGRQTIRLHPLSALELNAHCSQVVPDDPRGKVLVWPTGRSQSERLPVTKLLLLGDGYGSVSSVELAPILPQLLFRPVWMNAFPEQQSYRLGLLRLAQHLCAQRIPRIAGFSAIDRSNRAAVVLAAIDSMTR